LLRSPLSILQCFNWLNPLPTLRHRPSCKHDRFNNVCHLPSWHILHQQVIDLPDVPSWYTADHWWLHNVLGGYCCAGRLNNVHGMRAWDVCGTEDSATVRSVCAGLLFQHIGIHKLHEVSSRIFSNEPQLHLVH
jgi:hypothetical protein